MIQRPSRERLAARHLELCQHSIGVSLEETPGLIARYAEFLGGAKAEANTSWLFWHLLQAWCALNHISYHAHNAIDVFAERLDAVSEFYLPIQAAAGDVVQSAAKRELSVATKGSGAQPGWIAILGETHKPHLAVVEKLDQSGLVVIDFGDEGVTRHTVAFANVQGYINPMLGDLHDADDEEETDLDEGSSETESSSQSDDLACNPES